MIIGRAYQVVGKRLNKCGECGHEERIDARFPFNCPYGIYVGKLPNGFERFVWDGKDLMMNGGHFIEVEMKIFD